MVDDDIVTLGPFDIPHIGRRRVHVYAPPASKRAVASSSPRPVLYMFDGQNVFDDAPSFVGGWHLHRTVERLASRGRRAPVIVGIEHGGSARIDELSPWPSAHGGGRLDALLDWISGGLAPTIEHSFGVSSEPRQVGVGGSSMGGLAALYAHHRNPERFGLALAMSPSLWVGGGRMFPFIASKGRPWTSRIYLDCGVLEGRAMFASAMRMADELRLRGYDDKSLRWVGSLRGRHNEKSWARRASKAIEFLFSGSGTGAGKARDKR